MKESILIEMRNKVDALTRVIQQFIYDINETQDLYNITNDSYNINLILI